MDSKYCNSILELFQTLIDGQTGSDQFLKIGSDHILKIGSDLIEKPNPCLNEVAKYAGPPDKILVNWMSKIAWPILNSGKQGYNLVGSHKKSYF